MKKYREYPGFLQIIKLDSCDSTNKYLKENYQRLKESLPVLITAGQQIRGRGRRDRTWESKKGMGIYSSFGFLLASSSKINMLPLAAGIAVIETLNEIERLLRDRDSGAGSVINFGLKWPNDILAKKRKVAGILIENTIFKEEIFCVTGIGINLNHGGEDFPEALQDTATSLRLLTGRTFGSDDANKILSCIFFSWLEKLKNKEEKEIAAAANRHSSFLLGQLISFHRDNRILTAVYRGIQNDGGVILEDHGGIKRIYYSGEIIPASFSSNQEDKK